MITVAWPSAIAEFAEVWRVLDLSGMTKSVRLSKNVVKAGYVYVNGGRISGLKATVRVGSQFTLEIRWPSGKILSRSIFLVHRAFASRKQRSNTPRELKNKG